MERPGSKQDIISCLAFFDIFDHPLTLVELASSLDWNGQLSDLLKELQAVQEIRQTGGFYHLAERENIISERLARYDFSNRKIERARRFAGLFCWLPFVKLIAVSNSVGHHNLRDGSDIDLLVVTDPKRLWLTRLIMAGFAKLAGIRPTAKVKRDRICLSFYLSSSRLSLDDQALPEGDPYLHYWVRSLFPVYNDEKTFEAFIAANKNGAAELRSSEKSGGLLDKLEKAAKSFELRIMSPRLKEAAAASSPGVVIKDDIIKLYLCDKRSHYAQEHKARLSSLLQARN